MLDDPIYDALMDRTFRTTPLSRMNLLNLWTNQEFRKTFVLEQFETRKLPSSSLLTSIKVDSGEHRISGLGLELLP